MQSLERFFGKEILGNGQPVKVAVAEGTTLHICQAALPATANGRTVLSITVDGTTFCIGTLDTNANLFQMPLELVVSAQQQLSFSAKGQSAIHISGFIEPVEDEDIDLDDMPESDEEDFDDEEDSDDDDEDDVPPKAG